MLLLCSLGLLVGRRAPATSRAGCVRCGEEDSLHQLMAALRDEAAKRGRDSDLGKFEKLRKLGPQGQTSPKQVVEHVVLQLGAGNDEAAFAFTSLPPWRAGTHRSNTDWSKRMDWAKSRVISGQPSGALVDESSFGQLLSERFAFLRQTQAYRLVGDDSEWQQKRGREKMTAVKEYVVEVETVPTRRLGRLGRAAPSRTGRAPYPARRRSHSDVKRGGTDDSPSIFWRLAPCNGGPAGSPKGPPGRCGFGSYA